MKLYTFDAFTQRPFAGNPAAIVPLTTPLPEPLLQNLAAEMNLAETAYVWPEADGKLRLRWFTPAAEVKLCGHATLATAAALHRYGGAGLVPGQGFFAFETLSGALTTELLPDGRWQLDFPQRQTWDALNPPADLAETLGCMPLWVGETDQDGFLLLNAQDLRHLKPDFGRMNKWDWRGVMVTAQSDDPAYHCLTRCFYPKLTIDEDPVTGSAHCAVAPYWGAKLGLTDLLGYQASARGGEVGLGLRGDRVLLQGYAVPVLRAEVAIPADYAFEGFS